MKHFLDSHEGEKFEEMKFGVKIRSTARSAFERQVTESVLIQQESNDHHILNRNPSTRRRNLRSGGRKKYRRKEKKKIWKGRSNS